MTKAHLKFPVKAVSYLPKVTSRRMRMGVHGRHSAAYKSDGDSDDEDAKKALLKQIQEKVKAELDTRGFQKKDDVEAIVTEKMKAFEGLNLDALRSLVKEEGGVMAILKKQGEAIIALEERSTPGKKLSLRSLLDSKMDEIVKVLNSKSGSVELNLRAAAVMTKDSVVDDTTNALPDDMIESFSTAAFSEKRRGEEFIFEIADHTTVAEIEQYKTWLEEGDEQGAFAIVAEGAIKPLVSTSLVRNYSEAAKVAGKYVITEEVEKWRKNAYTIIKRLIQDKLMRDYKAILLTRLAAEAATYTGTDLDDTIAAPNDYDAIGAVAAQIESLDFVPDVLILHPQDKWRIRLAKDDNGRYQFPVVTEDGMTSMLSLRVVSTTKQTKGSFTLGEGKLFKIEDEPISMRIGYGITVTPGVVGVSVTQVVGDYDNNQKRVIVETFFNSYISSHHAGSFVTDTFANVKAALLAP